MNDIDLHWNAVADTRTADALAKLVDAYGFRFSNLAARKLGISEHVLFDACRDGLAKLEHSAVHSFDKCVNTYIVFG